MRVCLIYQAEFPDSERIEKTAKTLTAEGHEVFLLCNNYGKFPKPEEQVAEVHVVRVGPTFQNRTWNRILKFPIFLNPFWILALMRMIRRHRIDVLQVIDVPFSAAALAAGRWFGLPVIYDMWENYPEALRGWAKTDWKTRVFKNYHVARAVEKWVTRRVDHIFTVVEEARQRLLEDGIPGDRVSVVTNGVDLEMFLDTSALEAEPPDLEPGTYLLLYVGALTTERGLDDMIRALPLLRDRIPEIRLFIAGSGNDEARLRSIAKRESVEDLVQFLGWIPFRRIHAYVMQSHLCLVPHIYNEFINTTIPNKLFQYMALAKPVLVSHAKPLARIVRECHCGFVFESGNPSDAAEKIVEAYQSRFNPEIGEAGRRCAEQKYTWGHASRELVRIYRELAQNKRLRER